jgi:hypothetical protein
LFVLGSPASQNKQPVKEEKRGAISKIAPLYPGQIRDITVE